MHLHKKVDMRNYLFRFNSLKAVVKHITVLVVSVVMLLNLTQTAALAANNSETKTPLDQVPGITETVLDQNNSAAKEERREWQSRASSVRENEENKPTTLGEKLNVDELAKGYHPEREAEKRSVPTP
jgi:hypothetical protein